MDRSTAQALTPTSYIVLGLVERSGEATSYELKAMVAASIGNFWSVPHSALYAEPARLVESGHLMERRERGGRRRRAYSLTGAGHRALEAWRAELPDALPELRDLGLLKLFFGADPRALAAEQLEAHRAKLAGYEALKDSDDGGEPRGGWLALEAGIGHEREWIEYWRSVAEGELA